MYFLYHKQFLMPQTGYSHSTWVECEELTEVDAYPVNTYEEALRALKMKLPIFVLDTKSNELRKYYGGKKNRITKKDMGKTSFSSFIELKVI